MVSDNTKVLVRGVLFGKVKNKNQTNVPIYPDHLVSVENPTYPCVTLGKKGNTREDELGNDDLLFLSVWSKVSNDELFFIYNQIKPLLNLKSIAGIEATNFESILRMREIYTNDNLYESKTYTHHLATRYKVNTL